MGQHIIGIIIITAGNYTLSFCTASNFTAY